MKKSYIEPKFEVVKLNISSQILAGSVQGNSVTVSETNYDPNNCEDY